MVARQMYGTFHITVTIMKFEIKPMVATVMPVYMLHKLKEAMFTFYCFVYVYAPKGGGGGAVFV